jgi:hypothetical protein
MRSQFKPTLQLLLTFFACAFMLSAANAQSISGLGQGELPLIGDPKLTDGEIPFSFLLPSSGNFQVSINITQGSQPARLVRHLSSTNYNASGQTIFEEWDGKNMHGRYVAPGAYQIVIVAKGSTTSRLSYPIQIVRLGISEIEATSSAPTPDEWQMVYFRNATTYQYYITPSMAEYSNLADANELADLDLNNGLPRPAVALHTATDIPVMNGNDYEEFKYNYPLCYTKNATPTFEVKIGDSCTSGDGIASGVGFPLASFELRLVAVDNKGNWSAADGIVPGQTYTLTGPSLMDGVGREDRDMYWAWRYRETGTSEWQAVPGYFHTQHRYYTVHDEANWANGASGNRYGGPWVEVVDYMHQWATALNIDTSTDAGVVEALIRGYFGQDGPLTTAIEGVIYDTYTYGGDGGASHYYNWSSSTIRLRKLLHQHDLGVYLNCSDVASSTSGMLAMLGVDDMRMLYIGPMTLNAIWGIGTDDYTMDLWGNGTHSFSYHHIITRDFGTHVSDSCMWLDEDGNPRSLPGTPGQSFDRPWSGTNGYNQLSCVNNPNTSIDPLPFLN